MPVARDDAAVARVLRQREIVVSEVFPVNRHLVGCGAPDEAIQTMVEDASSFQR